MKTKINLQLFAAVCAIAFLLPAVAFSQNMGTGSSAYTGGDIYYNGSYQVGSEPWVPAYKLHVINGTPIGPDSKFITCDTIPESAYGIYSNSTTGSGFNVAILGTSTDDNSRNIGGLFSVNGDFTDEEEDCVINIGTSSEAHGDGLDSDDWIYNIGVSGSVGGTNSDNQGGGFYAENTSCYGNNIGVSAIASGGSLIAGIYAEAVNDSACVTDSATVAGGGKVPGVFAGYFNGNTFTAGSAYLASDRNLKQDLSEIENVSALLAKLEVKQYTFNQREYPEMRLPSGKHYGVIAQNVQEVFPELVKEISTIAPKNIKQTAQRETYTIKVVNYDEFIPLLIAAHKEQLAEIESLKQQLRQVCEQGCDKLNSVPSLDQGSLNIFPNPASETLQVNYSVAVSGSANNITIEVRDMQGKLFKTLANSMAQNNSFSMDVSELPAGNYFILLTVNHATLQSKMFTVAR